MIQALLGVAIMAGLFALSGIFRHRGCTGHCAGCTGACERFQQGDDHAP